MTNWYDPEDGPAKKIFNERVGKKLGPRVIRATTPLGIPDWLEDLEEQIRVQANLPVNRAMLGVYPGVDHRFAVNNLVAAARVRFDMLPWWKKLALRIYYRSPLGRREVRRILRDR